MTDDPSYVFKSSSNMAKVALQMDIDHKEAQDIQYEKYCYIDGTHSMYKGFKSLTLWVISHHREKPLPYNCGGKIWKHISYFQALVSI